MCHCSSFLGVVSWWVVGCFSIPFKGLWLGPDTGLGLDLSCVPNFLVSSRSLQSLVSFRVLCWKLDLRRRAPQGCWKQAETIHT